MRKSMVSISLAVLIGSAGTAHAMGPMMGMRMMQSMGSGDGGMSMGPMMGMRMMQGGSGGSMNMQGAVTETPLYNEKGEQIGTVHLSSMTIPMQNQTNSASQNHTSHQSQRSFQTQNSFQSMGTPIFGQSAIDC